MVLGPAETALQLHAASAIAGAQGMRTGGAPMPFNSKIMAQH